ncbi:DUF3318 domain-containing protein [Laspinema olomoucense]|uniref:DUF3318 domain-containing protein n=1 Tax=Laspinema olomoucense D3b TaxID=2953688 RepID=A0ABT2ND81_9CYAN|nr:MULTISPECIES: DUF3318 domain-containing protein [unclassified Laspinema]MCT7979295.1 DUF3318 domain-containing protein [Laspinema sp. D3b]MCT7988163.1 DUF3318 domain-containing protein [Laspinema sp. D3a]MCT7994737.1 DUF3318 domain-containing protein [Laspinema sp. D3c]
MDPSPEIFRLLDLMPASGRMLCKIVNKPQQSTAIESSFPLPWARERPIYINFDLWRKLSRPQRDLLLLRTVSWLLGVKWFKADLYQGVVIAGLLGTLVELGQRDAVGVVTAGGLTVLAGVQIWRSTHRSDREIEADQAAIQIALRRGYNEPDAARHLMSAIETVATLEGRPGLDFMELIRIQNLRAIAGLSAVSIPDDGIRE